MKKNFVRVMLFGALTLAVTTTVTSCKDYDDDIKGLQEQVDNIKSTNPVSTEDMKAAVDEATKALEKKVKDLQDIVDGKVTAADLKTKIDALEKKLTDGDKSVAKDLSDAKDALELLISGKADQSSVTAIQTDVDNLKSMQSTLQALIDAEKKFAANPEDLSGFENTSFDKFVNQSIMNALNDEGANKGAIAAYVTKAIQTNVLSKLEAIDTKVATLFGGDVKTLSDFIAKVHKDVYGDKGINDQIDALNELLAAIDAYVGQGENQYESYAAIIDQINDSKAKLAALSIEEGVSLSEAVKAIIATELGDEKATLAKLQAELQAEIAALKGMIQSIVYVPEYADGLVQLSTFYAQFGSAGSQSWEPIINGGDVKVRFRVSPKDAAESLIANFGKETAKYNVVVDYQTVKTRATGELFNITKIEAVEGEPNLIEVTLDASKAKSSYAIALTVTDKVAADKKTLNDITSNYFVAVKNSLYIKNVKWAPKEQPTTLVKGNTIDYKTGGDYALEVYKALNANGTTTGTKDERTKLSEYGISADNFPLTLELGGSNADKFGLTAKGVLSAKADAVAGDKAQVSYKIEVTSLGAFADTPKEYTGNYQEVNLISEGEAQTVVLASSQLPLLWHSTAQQYTLDATPESATVAAIAKIKAALGETNFQNCTFAKVAEDQTILLGADELGATPTYDLVLKVPANTTCSNATITTKITSADGNKSINVTVTGVTVSLPDANDAAFKLTDNTYTDATLIIEKTKVLLDPTDPTSSRITAVKAARDLTELYTNFSTIKGNLTNLGGTLKFALVDIPQRAAVERGVTVTEAGVVTVTNEYDGKGITVKLTGACGENTIFTKDIIVKIDGDALNGTFDYANADVKTLSYPVAKDKRGSGLDLSSAFTWTDADDKAVWPTPDATVYNGTSKRIFGFDVEYKVEGADASSFAAISDNTLKLIPTVSGLSVNTKEITVTVTATPKSPWGSMAGQAKAITVTVSKWADVN